MAIAVGAIDHDTVRDALFLLGVPSFFHVSVVVIGSLSRASEDYMAEGVPHGGNDGGKTLLGD